MKNIARNHLSFDWLLLTIIDDDDDPQSTVVVIINNFTLPPTPKSTFFVLFLFGSIFHLNHYPQTTKSTDRPYHQLTVIHRTVHFFFGSFFIRIDQIWFFVCSSFSINHLFVVAIVIVVIVLDSLIEYISVDSR